MEYILEYRLPCVSFRNYRNPPKVRRWLPYPFPVGEICLAIRQRIQISRSVHLPMTDAP